MADNAMFDREYFEIRHRLLDIGAALDRIHRADGNSADSDPRMDILRQASVILFDGRPNRAERAQMVFSDDYDPSWRK
jgi:hypothetical protein